MYKKLGLKGEFENPLHAHPAAWESGNVPISDFTRVYSDLRRTAIKRLNRLKRSRFNDSELVEQYGERFVGIPALKKEYGDNWQAAVVDRVGDLYKFLHHKGSTVTGQREMEKALIESMHERGLTFVNKKNLRQFAKFMEAWREQHQNRTFGSETAAMLFEETIRRRLNPEEIQRDFEFWIDNIDKLKGIPRKKNGKKLTADELKEEIEKREARKAKKRRKKG